MTALSSVGQKSLIILGLLLVISPWISSAEALLLGVALAILAGNPWKPITAKLSQKLLVYSVVGLGAGMNLITVASTGLHGFAYTAMSIAMTLALGWLLGYLLKTEEEMSWLISFGTAICGGSAIAALAPVIRAKPHSITVSLGVVFILNSVALILFPRLGHMLDFSEPQFGLWSALAIHDTSSVVGASLQYGQQALAIGTTVKLARALWIVPLTFLFSLLKTNGSSGVAKAQPKRPWFIFGFLLVAAIVTFIPSLMPIGQVVEAIARKGLVVTLYLIGLNLTLDSLKQVGLRPLIQGLVLWVIVGTTTAALIKFSILAGS